MTYIKNRTTPHKSKIGILRALALTLSVEKSKISLKFQRSFSFDPIKIDGDEATLLKNLLKQHNIYRQS